MKMKKTSAGGSSAAAEEIQRQRLVVFWEGTANTLNPLTTQIGLFSQICRAKSVDCPKDVERYKYSPPGPLKIAFDGCGVTHGNWGVLFANGLDEQCQLVLEIVEKMLECQQFSNETTCRSSCRQVGIHVVAVGLSRGGIACMKLARLLSTSFEKAEGKNDEICPVTCSTLLFDPVPGNALSTGFPWTAFYSFDLSQCHNLARVLALYPYEPLPDIAMHAPTLCRYNHSTTLVQEDVTMGCHQGALLLPNSAPPGQFPDLSLRRILDWLSCEGIECNLKNLPLRIPNPIDCIELMEYIRKRGGGNTTTTGASSSKENLHKSERRTHDEQRRKIIRYPTTNTNKRWLNRYHEQLVKALDRGDSSSSLLAVYGVYDNVEDDKLCDDDLENLKREQRQSFQPSGSYQLDFDEGYIFCPSPFTPGAAGAGRTPYP